MKRLLTISLLASLLTMQGCAVYPAAPAYGYSPGYYGYGYPGAGYGYPSSGYGYGYGPSVVIRPPPIGFGFGGGHGWRGHGWGHHGGGWRH